MTTSPRLIGALWRFRFVLAALCLTAAGLLVMSEFRPAQPTGTVTVAARDLPAGTVLSAADLRSEPALDPPSAALPAEALIGATLVAGLPEGMPVAETLLVSPGLVDAAPAGTVVVPVTLADPQLMALVRVGDRLRLYQSASWQESTQLPDGTGSDHGTELVADDALVLARLDETGDANGLLDMTASESSGVVVVAIDPEAATVLSGASALAPVRAVVVPGDQP
ncbi:flagellar biosynthesis protein FlgA [Ruania alkalisoli]|uniref:Flagellar biosynthesis protein FlgA n=1 Tax=Ruania alkalisoli TaxID=2779775 RepID=A0A7M1SVN9_9MICO|nr:SAF domain-containing protein [Ruania alkalisoli]QOR71531.1 flagellar biosynthesis protein FlgA [Ruania alkalisoli]